MNNQDIAASIDYTMLRPDTSLEAVQNICNAAIKYSLAAVCIPPYFVKDAAKILDDYLPKVATVVGFPMGYAATPAKVEEVKRAIDEGVDEIDFVVNLCAVKQKNWNFVKNDIDTMTRAAHLRGKKVKVILEVAILNEDEIAQLCQICNTVDVDFVKTSTGLYEGATPEIITQLKQHLNKTIKIKASGGIRTREAAIALLNAGANRLGTSQIDAIIGR